LQQARDYQKTDAFKRRYRQRAGVEGTISQATDRFALRRARYRGLAKAHLQHIFTVLAINMARLAAYFAGTLRAQTRISPFAALAPAQHE
jgi:IS5 family transposase